MSSSQRQQVGLTKSVGYQIGVRRTLPIGVSDAWRMVTSPEGLNLWLGPSSGFELATGVGYRLDDGSAGKVRVCTPDSHLRITWQPPDWPRASTIQVRVIDRGDRTTIAFHEEHLPGPTEREVRRGHFRQALDEMERAIMAQGERGRKGEDHGP